MTPEGQTRRLISKRPKPRSWWLLNKRYAIYMLRELTAIPLLGFVLLCLYQLIKLSAGQSSYESLLSAMSSPAWILINAFILVASILHSVTWILLMPKGLPEFIVGIRVPPAPVLFGGFATWIAVSGIIVTICIRL